MKEDWNMYRLHQLYKKHDWREVSKVRWNIPAGHLQPPEPIYMCCCGAFACHQEVNKPALKVYTLTLDSTWIQCTLNQIDKMHKKKFIAFMRFKRFRLGRYCLGIKGVKR